MGIQKYVRLNHIDGFLGPADPAPAYDAKQMCGTIYLASVNFQCQPSSQQPGWSHVTGVRVYSRVPAADAGLLPLPEQDLVWSPSGYLGLWRLQP
jgi:hypothetical protein